MPGASEKVLEVLEARVKQMRSVTEMIREGAQTSDLAFEMLEDLSFRRVEESRQLAYRCHCSMKRVERSLLLVGVEELEILIQKNEPAQVSCDFCGRQYLVDLPLLNDLLRLAKNRS